jgi:hypothetical protein
MVRATTHRRQARGDTHTTESEVMRIPVSGTYALIDDAGRILRWPEDSRRLAPARSPDFDFPDYAVRNLGFIAIAEREGSVRIRLRPRFCSHRTVAALLAYLSHRPHGRIGITYFVHDWKHEVCTSGRPLERRLIEILGAGDEETGEPPFVAVPRRVTTLLRMGDSPFAPLLRRWLDNLPPEGMAGFLESCGLLDRSMIVERMPDSGHFVFRHSGRGIQLYPSGWSSAAAGRYLHDQPDHAYGRWIDAACRSVDDCQVPRFELISARVAPAGGRPARQWRYERLMLPWRAADGRHLVVSVSQRDQAPGGDA